MPEQQGICPECGETIDHLDFQANVSQWGRETGSADLDGENWDYSGDFEVDDARTDEVTYSCPSCGDEVNPDDIQQPEDEEETERKPAPVLETECSLADSGNRYSRIIVAKCPKCKEEHDIDTGEVDCCCPHCHEEFPAEGNTKDL